MRNGSLDFSMVDDKRRADRPRNGSASRGPFSEFVVPGPLMAQVEIEVRAVETVMVFCQSCGKLLARCTLMETLAVEQEHSVSDHWGSDVWFKFVDHVREPETIVSVS